MRPRQARPGRRHRRRETALTEPQQGIYGIDLGTTYSVVGYIDETGRAAVVRNIAGGSDTTPSVVYFESESNVVVGETAKAAAGESPEQVVSLIKREMGEREYRRTFFGKEYTPPSISAIILEALAHRGRGGYRAQGDRRGDHRSGLLRPAGEGRHQEGRRDRWPQRDRDRPGTSRRGAAVRSVTAARTAPLSSSTTWAAARSTSP